MAVANPLGQPRLIREIKSIDLRHPASLPNMALMRQSPRMQVQMLAEQLLQGPLHDTRPLRPTNSPQARVGPWQRGGLG